MEFRFLWIGSINPSVCNPADDNLFTLWLDCSFDPRCTIIRPREPIIEFIFITKNTHSIESRKTSDMSTWLMDRLQSFVYCFLHRPGAFALPVWLSLLYMIPIVDSAAASLGIFEKQADWGTSEFPPQLGEFKIPGRVDITMDDSGYVYDLYGNGDDIMITDEAFFVYLEKSGSWRLSGKVEWIDRGGTHPYAQAGLMIREAGESAYSNFYAMLYHAGRGPKLGWTAEIKWRNERNKRPTANLINSFQPNPGVAVYFRVTRIASRNLMISEWSTDGNDWHTALSLSLPMRDSVSFGLVVCNVKDNQSLAHVRFSDVRCEPVQAEAIRRIEAVSYAPLWRVPIQLEIINPSEQNLTASVQEQLPVGWKAEDISHDGEIRDNRIHWSCVINDSTAALHYTAVAPPDASGLVFFQGAFNQSPIHGETQLLPAYITYQVRNSIDWRYWNHEDGLSKSFTHTIDYGNDSVLWINSDKAQMSVFDGYRFLHLPGPGPIAKFLPSPNGRLRAVFQETMNAGLVLSEFESNRWQTVPSFQTSYPDYLLTMSGPRFVPVGGSQIMILEPTRIRLFDIPTQKYTILKHIRNTGFTLFNGLCPSRDGFIWVACKEGVAALHPVNGAFSESSPWREHPIPKEFNTIWHQNIVEKNGSVWGNGRVLPENRQAILRFDGRQWSIPVYLPDEDVEYISTESDGSIWVKKLSTQALSRFKGCHEETMTDLLILSSDILDAETTGVDRFFLSNAQGVATFAPPVWRTPIELKTYTLPMSSIVQDESGQLWVAGTRELFCYTQGLWHTLTFPERYITQWFGNPNLFLLPNGRLGIRVKEKQGARRQLSSTILALDVNHWMEDLPVNANEPYPFDTIYHPSNYSIGPVASCRDGGLWIATTRNDRWYLEKFDGTRFETLLGNLNISYMRSMFEDSSGRLWMCDNQSVAIYHQGEYKRFTAFGEFPTEGVYFAGEIEPGRLWFGGEDKVWQYHEGEWSIVLSGITSAISIFVESKDDVWIGTTNGIHRFYKELWMANTIEDGLPHNLISSIYRDRDGSVWVSTDRGISRHHPEADRDAPKTFILENENSREISPKGEARIVYQGMDRWKYTQSSRLFYSYQFNGEAWSPWTSSTIFSTAGLKAGQYAFRVRSIDRNWNIEEHPAVWDFRVLYPWYLEPGFLAISFFGTLLSVFLAVVAIQKHLKLRESNFELQKANNDLLELNKMKSNFFSQASHDFRTPLTVIKGSLDNLKCGAAGDLNPLQMKVMNMATASLTRLTKMVNDVLDLNRIETGRLDLNRVNFSLTELINRIVLEQQMNAEQKKITIHWNSDGDSHYGYYDANMIERVFLELINNAVKYTSEEGDVWVDLRKHDRKYIFSVRDNGIGISPDEIKKIWEPFYRVRSSQNFAKGSGLGLTIVRELIEKHQGTITVESQSGHGAAFTVILPA